MIDFEAMVAGCRTGAGVINLGGELVHFDQTMNMTGSFEAVVIDDRGQIAVKLVTAPVVVFRPRDVTDAKDDGRCGTKNYSFIGRVTKREQQEQT